MPLTPEGIALLQRVKQRILAEPDKFDMYEWYCSIDGEYDWSANLDPFFQTLRSAQPGEPCGTTACIAGWVLLESGVQSIKNVRVIEDAAAVELGVYNKYRTEPLFYVSEWPNDLQKEYKQTKSPQVAAQAIDRWIAGNGSFAESAHDGAEVER